MSDSLHARTRETEDDEQSDGRTWRDHSTTSERRGTRNNSQAAKSVESTTEETTDESSEVEETVHCPECESTDLITDDERGETVCADCGLVVDEDSIDRGPEWRAFDSAERDQKSRVGAPTTKLMHDKGLSTNIGWQDKDAYGNSLSSTQRQKMQRLRTWNERFRTRDSKERNLARVSRVDEDEFERAYRYIVRELSLEIQPADPAEYVPRFASDLEVPKETERTARELLESAKRQNVHSGKSPVGLAAAALYASAQLTNDELTQADVSEVTDISEVTIRNRYQELLEAWDNRSNGSGADAASA